MRAGMRWTVATMSCLLGVSAQAATAMKGETVRIPAGEVAVGDRYVAGGSVEVMGRLEGDLLAASASISVPGEVTGNVNAGGSIVTIGGHVGKAVRVVGSTTFVTGTIDGDLIFVGASLTVSPGARVNGDVWAFSGDVTVGGDVGGDLLVRSGRLVLTGHVGGSADVEVDALTVDGQARIEGDLRYVARRPPTTALPPVVAGRIERVEPKKEEESSGLTVWGVAFWLIRLLGAALLGLLCLRLFPARSAGTAASVGREPAMALGVGLGTGLVVPLAAAILAVISLFVAAPLAVILWLLVAVGLYLGKLPVALWIGQRLLRRPAAEAPGPAALLLGVLLLYLAFATPYVGTLLWFISAFVGLGAIVLGFFRRSQVTPSPV